jgi:NAD(P)-dependent dehydrogenase (short-subunit alcohol dehydrogenase family)
VTLKGKAVVITGGTRGIGRAIAGAFARQGASLWLTHRWGSVPDEEVRTEMLGLGASGAEVVEADAAQIEDTERLVRAIAEKHDAVHTLVSNVCVVGRGGSLEALEKRSLLRALRYSAYPILEYLQTIESILGTAPRYVLASSSDGPDQHYPGYDYVGLSKAVLEGLARDIAKKYGPTGTHVHILRTRLVETSGFEDMFPPEAQKVFASFREYHVATEDVARVALLLVSGWLDGLNGQIVNIDRGASFKDNLATTGPVLMEAFGGQSR